jgi:serine-type D-Ala-D-Ala carboxypeptidase/endopeptidase (penicillin-binding protein 4)
MALHPLRPLPSPDRRSLPWALLLPALGLAAGCATLPGAGPPTLRDQIESIILAPPLDQVHWGIHIVDPDRGQILYSHNSHRKFVPASNMKILSTAAALALLGPEYRYETELWGVGPLRQTDGVLEGDLVLRATGDPTFSQRFYPSAEAPLDSLAQGLWAAGVRGVTGSLVVDVSPWDSTTVPGTWMVANLPGTSAATGGAFSIGEGELTVEVVAAGGPGDPAQVRWWPGTEEEFFHAAFVTVAQDSASRGRRTDYFPETRRLWMEGRIPVGAVDTIRVAQRDPVSVASVALLHALERRGIQVEEGLRISWDAGMPLGPGTCFTGQAGMEGLGLSPVLPDCSEASRLAGIESPPMREVVRAVLEPSQNWMTEQLVKTLGMELGRKGSWGEGFRVQQEFFVQEVGLDSLDITYRDGSGLSAYNLVTPRALIRTLDYMRSSPHAGIYREAMPSPGKVGSTLRSRMPGLEGRVFAKTGTITHVNSLSGYVFTESGRELIFSILTNGSGLPSVPVRTAIDQIVAVIARH